MVEAFGAVEMVDLGEGEEGVGEGGGVVGREGDLGLR